jgi:hypothetical protein
MFSEFLEFSIHKLSAYFLSPPTLQKSYLQFSANVKN